MLAMDDIRKYPRSHKLKHTSTGRLRCCMCSCTEMPPQTCVLRCPTSYDLQRRWFDTQSKCFRASKLVLVTDVPIFGHFVAEMNPRICPMLADQRRGGCVSSAIIVVDDP